MAATANFASTPRSKNATISAANTNRDGTGTIVAVWDSTANGSRVDRIEVKAVAATTAGMVRAFKRFSAGPWKLWREYPVAAATPSATVKSFEAIDDEIADILDTGEEIGFATHNAETFEVFVKGGAF